MLSKYIALTIGVAILLFSCSKVKKERPPESVEETSVYEEEKHEEETSKIEITDNLREEIGLIDEFTPEIFVKLTILYRRETKKWLLESKKLSPDKQHAYYEEANRKFFESFGTTEEDYFQYSQSNMDELNAYMSENPELLDELIEQ